MKGVVHVRAQRMSPRSSPRTSARNPTGKPARKPTGSASHLRCPQARCTENGAFRFTAHVCHVWRHHFGSRAHRAFHFRNAIVCRLGNVVVPLNFQRKSAGVFRFVVCVFARILCYCSSRARILALCLLGRCVRGAFVPSACSAVSHFWRCARYALFSARCYRPHCYLHWAFAGINRYCELRN